MPVQTARERNPQLFFLLTAVTLGFVFSLSISRATSSKIRDHRTPTRDEFLYASRSNQVESLISTDSTSPFSLKILVIFPRLISKLLSLNPAPSSKSKVKLP